MLINQEFELNSPKINSNTLIIQISDLHANNKTDFLKLNKIYLEKIKDTNPNYILFCGDLINDASYFNQNLLDFIELLAKISPIIICLGNHDLMTLKKDSSTNIFTLKWTGKENESYIKALKSIPNVYLLRNENQYFENHNINFTGLEAQTSFYEYHQVQKLIDQINKEFSNELDESQFNHIMFHSPEILKLKYFKQLIILKHADVATFGHTHNGLLPLGFNKIFDYFMKTRGFYTKDGGIFPEFTRSITTIDQTTCIIGGHINAIPETHSISKVLKLLCPPMISTINIKRSI